MLYYIKNAGLNVESKGTMWLKRPLFLLWHYKSLQKSLFNCFKAVFLKFAVELKHWELITGILR